MPSNHTHTIRGVSVLLLAIASVLATATGGNLLAGLTDPAASTTRSRRAAARENSVVATPEYAAWMDGTERYYYSTAHLFRFILPLRWQGRPFIDDTALLSPGFAPFLRNEATGALKRIPAPEEEIQIVVRPAPDTATSAGLARGRGGSDIGSMTLGGRDAARYKLGGNEIVTAISGGKQIDLILVPAGAGDRLRAAYDRAVNSFEFLNGNLRRI